MFEIENSCDDIYYIYTSVCVCAFLFVVLVGILLNLLDILTKNTLINRVLCRIIKSIDSVLHFSETFKIHDLELGHVFVLFFFNIITALIDSTLNDWGFQVTFNEISFLVPTSDQYMEIDHSVTQKFQRGDFHEQIRKRNAITALEVLERLSESRKATILLQSVLFNMYGLPPFLYFSLYDLSCKFSLLY